MSKLAQAFKELCAVCRPRPDQDEAVLMAAASRLWKVLGEYPEPVALAALDLWPRRSEWFPTERELRDLLEELASKAAIDAAARGRIADGRYLEPVGKTHVFVERVRKLRGDDYCKSWLAGGITCLFSADTVFTTGIGVERLNRDVRAIIDATGVTVRRSATASRMLADYCDKRELKFDPGGGRRKR